MKNRVLFKKGMQREFLDLVIRELNCLSLRGILQFGFNIKYSSLKNYYIERRLIPEEFFNDLCYLSKIDKVKLNVKYLKRNWGQIKGGKRGKKKKI